MVSRTALSLSLSLAPSARLCLSMSKLLLRQRVFQPHCPSDRLFPARRTVKYRRPFLLPKSLVETVISRVIDTSRDCLKWRKTPKKEMVETWESREWRNFFSGLEFLFLWVFFWFIQLSIRIFPKLLFFGFVCFFFPLCRVGCRDCWTGFSNETAVVGRNYTSSEHIDVGDIVPRENKEADVQPKDRQRHTHAIHRVLCGRTFFAHWFRSLQMSWLFSPQGGRPLFSFSSTSEKYPSKWTFI